MVQQVPSYSRFFIYAVFSALFTWIVAIEASIGKAEKLSDFLAEAILLIFLFLIVFLAAGWFARRLRKVLISWPLWVNTIYPRFTINFILIIVQTLSFVFLLNILISSLPFISLPYGIFQNDLWLIYAFPLVIFSLVWLVEGALDMFFQRQNLLLQNERLEKEHLFSQLQSLKNQLRPHFLFNHLNALSNLVYKDAEKADFFIQKLANIYRYVLEVSDEVVIPLVDELEFVNNYIALQKIRFNKNLIFNNLIPEAETEYLIPPLSLELLIENAIKHNIITQDAPLRISLETKNGFLIVKNNYQPVQTQINSSKKGLANLGKRLKLLGVLGFEFKTYEHFFIVRVPLIAPES
jgi:sensor histidine kinase YesM